MRENFQNSTQTVFTIFQPNILQQFTVTLYAKVPL